MTRFLRVLLFISAGLAAGCTLILGIDEDYRPKEPATGGTGGRIPGAGGGAGTGGSTGAVGGVGGVAGVAGVGGATSGGSSGMTCATGEKLCDFRDPSSEVIVQQCVEPSPLVGCSLDNCDRCYPEGLPPNADPICTGDQCDLECIPNYEACAGRCEPVGTCNGGNTGGSSATGGTSGTSGTGGTGGTGGTDGSGGSVSCDVTQCKNTCNIAGPLRCCKQSGFCGCTWQPTPNPAFCY